MLSTASIGSEWVQRELGAALQRELEERKVFILPVLIEDCEIPPLLRDKRYADFREDYAQGLADLLAAIQPPDLGTSGTFDDSTFHNDYALDWGRSGEMPRFRFSINSYGEGFLYSVQCEVIVSGNEAVNARMRQLSDAGYASMVWGPSLFAVAKALAEKDRRLLIEGDDVATEEITIADRALGTELRIAVTARRLGANPRHDVVYDWGDVVRGIIEMHLETAREAVPPEKRKEFLEYVKGNPPGGGRE